MTRAQRRADRARRMSPKWRREHPGEIPPGFKSNAGRNKDSFVPIWRRRDKEALVIQFVLTAGFRIADYNAAELVALVCSRKPIAATAVEVGGRTVLKLSAVTDQNTLLASYADHVVRSVRTILARGCIQELDWLTGSSVAVRKLIEAHRVNDQAAARQWLIALDLQGWRPFLIQLAERLKSAMQSNFPPDAEPTSRKAIAFAEWLSSEAARLQEVGGPDKNRTASIWKNQYPGRR